MSLTAVENIADSESGVESGLSIFVRMDCALQSSAVQALFRGILEDDLDLILASLKEVSLETKLDTEIIDGLLPEYEDCISGNGLFRSNGLYRGGWSVPRVPSLLPLHLASVCGNVEIIRLLIGEGAGVDSMLDDEETALHFACLYGNVNCVQALVNCGCDVNIQTRTDTPLMLATACFGTCDINMKEDYLTIAQILIEARCDVNIPDSQGLTALHLAAGKEDPSLIKLLIKAGADINAKARASVHPSTPLIAAVSAELEENVQILLNAGCHVNEVIFPGVSALSTALDNNALGIVLDLLLTGADPMVREDTLNIQMLLSNRQYISIRLLLVYGLSVNWQNTYDQAPLLLTVTRQGNLPMVQFLLENGADPNADNCLGTTPLWSAVKLNHQRILTALLRWNCDLDICSLEYNPLIPLVSVQLAIQMGFHSVAKRLLHFGCYFRSHWLEAEPIVSRVRDSLPFRLWISNWMSTPKALHHLCMVTIRKHIGPALPRKIKTITLPGKLKNYIITGDL